MSIGTVPYSAAFYIVASSLEDNTYFTLTIDGIITYMWKKVAHGSESTEIQYLSLLSLILKDSGNLLFEFTLSILSLVLSQWTQQAADFSRET